MITNWTTINNMYDLLNIPNTVTNGWFYVVILFMIFFIIVIALINFGIEIALITSSSISFIISIFLAYAGLITQYWLLAFVAINVLMIFYVYISSKAENQ